jgi:hypothetical protein
MLQMLPDEIVKKIVDYVDDTEKKYCHTCWQKISCIDNYITQSKMFFCSSTCYHFIG